ncbi:FAD-dependent oxidoreductase [Pseudaestuariivita sp.]|uniref:FAD-dependent oxidoreductase n=1 Tax=Pseudaestuariivita sp. TaxID=2211669 RepID=UPI0040594F85
MAFDYDLFVIGGGSGGVRAARVAASETGAKVALAEESRYGGTCVIRGCVPKKMMVFASSYPAAMEEAQAYGWDVTTGPLDWPKFQQKMAGELDRLEGVYRSILSKAGVETFDQRATIADPHTVKLADGTTKTAKHILIATGGRPTRPDLPNAHLGIVSDDIFHLETLPKKILIVGGGYIACEFACILNGLGVDVTIFHRGAQILRGFDDEARGLVADVMRSKGITIHTGASILEMAPAEGHEANILTGSDASMGADAEMQADLADETSPKGAAIGPIWAKAMNGQEGVFDMVFFATGRRPNTDDMGLEEAGVALKRNGAISVDDYSQTGVPSIYAIGDVTGRVELTPVAIREGMKFVETVFKGNPTPVDHELIPSAVFTQPELGTIGMTEQEAIERDAGPVEIYATSFRPMKQAFADGTDRVLMKLVVDKESRTVLGCHIVAPDAGEMIQLAGIAVKMGATKEQFDATCAVHPTMAEELVTMRHPVRTA